jgi:divalent metal cation (Fe/Co/Zn/Cd) transporter
MEIVMPASFILSQVHDIALELQHKLEALEEVERAFVHVDYEKRDHPEHKVSFCIQQSVVCITCC